MTRMALMILGAAVTLSAAPAFAREHERSVGQQLDIATLAVARYGFRRVEDFNGYLRQGGRAQATVRLSGGYEYIIIGACDADCGDLDLSLADRWGDVRAFDLEYDDLPYLAIDNVSSSTNRVEVEMAHCAVQPCAFGLAVFRR